MDKVTLKLSRDEMFVMQQFCGAMVGCYQHWGDTERGSFDPWAGRLKVASLAKLNVKLAGKMALSKREMKLSFSILEIGGFLAGFDDFNWDESDPFVIQFVTRIKQEVEPKFK